MCFLHIRGIEIAEIPKPIEIMLFLIQLPLSENCTFGDIFDLVCNGIK